VSGAERPWVFEPETWTKQHVERLISYALVTIDCPLTQANSAMIESGKDDLLENAGTLFSFLDGLPDRERANAYRALYFVIRGAASVGSGHLTTAIDGMHQRDKQQGIRLRSGRTSNKKKPACDAIVAAVIAEQVSEEGLPPHGRTSVSRERALF
jgi:hypothetical protein